MGSALALLFRPLVDVLDRGIRGGRTTDPFQRDPALVARLAPLLRAVTCYFGTEVRGWERVPARGPFLIVGNHSGGAETNDFWFLLAKWVEDRGPEAPLYGLAYDLLFAYPVLGTLLHRLGGLPANAENARRALAARAAVAVFPGGDYEVFRPWRARNRICFGGHTGFVQVALATGVPVVPMTIHGAHQSTFVLTRGRRLARLLGIDRLHVNVFPLVWNLPFGIVPAYVPSVQLPAKVTVEMGVPLDWSRHGPAAAGDPATVRACYDEITTVMQESLDALARERPYPVLARLAELTPRPLVRLVSGRPPPRAVRSRADPRPVAARSPRARSRRRARRR